MSEIWRRIGCTAILHVKEKMRLFIVRNYQQRYPQLKGKDLTDQLILELAAESGIDTKDLIVRRTEKGKPCLSSQQNPESTLPFVSVSHCADTFACVFDDDQIGIDIQDERVANADRIGRRYYTQEEQTHNFYAIWTRKEALCKYTGEGLAQILKGESVLDRDDVTFENFVIERGLHACICRPAGKEEGAHYEIQFFD